MSRSTINIRGHSTSNNFNSNRDPINTDDITRAYDIGSLWVNVLTDKCFVCLDNFRKKSIWKIITPDPKLETKVLDLEARILFLERVIKDLTGLIK
jgi:hypothetical protein